MGNRPPTYRTECKSILQLSRPPQPHFVFAKMPFFSLFSREKNTAQSRDDPKLIKEEKPISTKFRSINQKVNSHPAAFSLPIFVQHSRGFRDFYQEPEEEVFSISLESPVKKLSQSYDWMDR